MGVASYFRSVLTESHCREAQIQNADSHTNHVTNQVRGSVPRSSFSFRPTFVTPHFNKVCGCSSVSSSTTGHPHTELYRWLDDFHLIRANGGLTLKLRLNAKKSVLFPFQRTTFLGMVWDLTMMMEAHLSPTHDASIPSPTNELKLGQSLTVTVSWTVKSDSFCPAVYETFAMVSQNQGIFPKEKSVPHYQGHAAMPSCLCRVEVNLGFFPRDLYWRFLVIESC